VSRDRADGLGAPHKVIGSYTRGRKPNRQVADNWPSSVSGRHYGVDDENHDHVGNRNNRYCSVAVDVRSSHKYPCLVCKLRL
jgi:hypothetical protein